MYPSMKAEIAARDGDLRLCLLLGIAAWFLFLDHVPHNAVSLLPNDDALRDPYQDLTFVHPDSVLAQYLRGGRVHAASAAPSPIFPFRSNLSQRRAIDIALSSSISVIEGPPGTGKTETILNLLSTILAAGVGTVGVVSFTNAAVENVRDKLFNAGFGYIVADL